MGKENIEDKYGCSIEHFIQDEYSICREERQYALFLYNILRKYHSKDMREGNDIVKNLLNACNIPSEAEIENVFYEAAFMRDFFERSRRLALSKNPEDTLLNITFSPSDYTIKNEEESFNVKLIEYAAKQVKPDISYKGKEINLGRNAFELVCNGLSEKEIRDVKLKIKYMMNATPDIAVIYSENKQNKLLFLECKFESQESSYEGGYYQRGIQWEIAKFLCGQYLSEEVQVSDIMDKEKKSGLVRFVRKAPNEPNEIWIKDLIGLHEKIFL